jgi:hypothetical protein
MDTVLDRDAFPDTGRIVPLHLAHSHVDALNNPRLKE